MLEPVPSSVVTAIYLYFALVASLGLALHWRLWRGSRVTDSVGTEAEVPHADVERPTE
jgi:hypothetical protein